MVVEVLPTMHSVSIQTESVQESTDVTTEMHPAHSCQLSENKIRDNIAKQ